MSDQLCPSCAGRSDDGLICQRCTAKYRKDLRAIPGLMRELETTLTRQSQTGTGNGGKNATRPLPYDTKASELGGEVKMTLVNWVRTFILGDEWPGDSIPSICGWLLARDQRVRGHEEAPEFVDEIGDVVRQIRYVIDLRPEMVYLGVCSHVLRQEVGEDGEQHPVHCLKQMYARKRHESYDCPGQHDVPCGAVYNVEVRRTELLALAAHQLATVGLCAQVLGLFGLPVKADTIWNWVRPREVRGRTYPPKAWAKGTNDKGESLYLVGDIEALVRESIAVKEAKQRARAG